MESFQEVSCGYKSFKETKRRSVGLPEFSLVWTFNYSMEKRSIYQIYSINKRRCIQELEGVFYRKINSRAFLEVDEIQSFKTYCDKISLECLQFINALQDVFHEWKTFPTPSC